MSKTLLAGIVVCVVAAAVARAAEESGAGAPPIPAFQGGGELRGVAVAVPPPPYKVRWQYRTGGEDRAAVQNSPTIAGDTVYVGDASDTLHAINLADGKVRWTYKIKSGFETTPLVLDGHVYLGDMEGLMHCVSADKGTKVWTFDSGVGIHSSANVAAASDGKGKLILFGNDGAQVFALDAATGKKVWEGKGGDRINACPAVARGGAWGTGVALFSGCDARLMALDLATGNEKFATELPALAPGSAGVVGDRAIVGTDGGTVVAVSAEGKVLWKYEDVEQEGQMFYSSPAIDAAAGTAVIGGRDRAVHAIDVQTGKRKWAFKTRGDVDAAPAISDGRVYAGSKDKKLYVLDLKTGAKLWEFAAGRGIEAGVAIGKDSAGAGVIVLGDTAGNVYCFEAEKK